MKLTFGELQTRKSKYYSKNKESKELCMIPNAIWYVSNQTLHEDLKISDFEIMNKVLNLKTQLSHIIHY